MPKPEDSTDNDEVLRARLNTLSKALKTQRDAPGQREGEAADLSGSSFGQAMNLGFRVLSEFVAGIVVGALIGWQLDVWLGTSPLLLIAFLMLGTAAGFWNVYRIAAKPTGRSGTGVGG